ncbi:hypothetical protein PHYPO_G00210980 [Pangasianodon hypophthalmus]|uniref:Probable proton-coupled zinc antiporter SLC30A4 n=1 Tax=Pangasianodon hypophthalmus TaxID=310915 RepID=A0A5N5P535_PANHP|nr:zinc transporter 4 [Pangasianodon hypophthalmus]KAB5574609.1 hypothetical protein PHYPO_G00210980 [Pangasianodon hypophthalmus]
MSGADLLSRVSSVFRRDRADWDLSDSAAFDFSEDLAEDEMPRFNKLKVVVSAEMDEYTGSSPNGAAVSTFIRGGEDDDDDSLLGSTSGLGAEPCDNCAKRKEDVKRRKVMKKLVIAAVLYFLFMIGELVGGYIANSLAIMTDALHMLTDLVGIVVSLLALWLSAKPPTHTFNFGLHRLEVMSAGISVLLIYILTGVLLNEAVQRTLHPDFTIDGDVMLITAAVGVAVNLIMGFLLNQSGHLHSHAHSHSHSAGHAHSQRRGQGRGRSQHSHGSLAVRAAFIHALGDLVQSVGVLIAAYIVRFKPEYKLADPVCTYIFSVLVLVTTVRIIRDTGLILLEGVPRHLNASVMREDLLKLDGVEAVEDLKLWALTADRTVALAHLQLAPGSVGNWEEVQSKARHLLMMSHGVSHCTVQLQSHTHRGTHSCSNCVLTSA